MITKQEFPFANLHGYSDVEPYEVVRVISDKTRSAIRAAFDQIRKHDEMDVAITTEPAPAAAPIPDDLEPMEHETASSAPAQTRQAPPAARAPSSPCASEVAPSRCRRTGTYYLSRRIHGRVVGRALGTTDAAEALVRYHALVAELLADPQVGDLFALARYRQHVDWKLILRLLPGVLAGVVLTAILFTVLDAHALDRIVGALILVSVGLEIWRRRRPSLESEGQSRWAASAFFGTLAGMTTMAANAGGAAMSLYLINMRVSMLAFMGTSAWFFFFLNLLKIPVVVAVGGADGASNTAVMAPPAAAAMPYARLKEYAHLGHFGPLQDPITISVDVREAFGAATN